MTRFSSDVLLLLTFLILASAEKNSESISDVLLSASTVELKRIPKIVDDDISVSGSIVKERFLPEYQRDVLDNLDSIPRASTQRQDSGPSSNGIFSETKDSIPKKSTQSSSKASGYGYPYRMAPTLSPYPKHISDRYDDDDESQSKPSAAPTKIIPYQVKIPPMPRMPKMPKMSSEESGLTKNRDTLKKRQGLPFDDDSSQSSEYSPISFEYSSYKEPSYRNSHDLEFSPRRMYYESSGPQSRPTFSFPKLKPSPAVSPRDPYLSPSSEPIDGFYPKVKNNGVSSSYSSYGKRDKYYKSIPDPPPSRGYDDSSDFSDTSSEEDDYHLGQGGYVKSPKYQDRPSSYPDSYSEPAPNSYSEPAPKEPVGDVDASLDPVYNSPIIGVTRKRLLEYAGATDLYQGEPDYMKSIAVRKTKFDSIQDDYYPYPRSKSISFTDYPFDESRRVTSRTKRQVIHQEQADVPRCAINATLPMCLTDPDYPSDEVRKLVSKNMKFLSELRNTRLEINKKKSTSSNVPESKEDLKETKSVCSSKKGNVYPKKAKDINGIWRTVINEEVVKQSIDVELCRSIDTPCDYVPAAIPTKCVQKFSFVTLIAFNAKDNAFEQHDFLVPSACACSVGRPTRVYFE